MGMRMSELTAPAQLRSDIKVHRPPNRPLPALPPFYDYHEDDTDQRLDILKSLYGIPYWITIQQETTSEDHPYHVAVAKQSETSSTSSSGPGTKKRSSPAENEEDGVYATKAVRLGHRPLALSADAREEADAPLHAPNGIVDGRYLCTCSKSYTKAFALNRHVEAKSRVPQYECLICNTRFTRKDSLLRHDCGDQQDKRVSCPGCNQPFRQDYLRKHLKSPSKEACRIAAEAFHARTQGLSIDARPDPNMIWTPDALEGVHFPLDGRDTPGNDFNLLKGQGGWLEPIFKHYQCSEMRLTLRSKHAPCSLCGMPPGSNETEILDHIKYHSLEFVARPFQCTDCCINFMFQADLQAHLNAARKSSCGFYFMHSYHPTKNGLKCGGHHPPTALTGLATDDHQRMMNTLFVWENRQVRAHLAAVARLQAELLLHRKWLRYSLQNEELLCTALLSRLSIGSIASFHSGPARLESEDETQQVNFKLVNGLELTKPSMVTTHRAMSSLHGSSKPSHPALPQEPAKNSYVEQLKALRGPGGLKRKASGVRCRATAATQSLLAERLPSVDVSISPPLTVATG